ncbi:MAG: DUF424 domain-containing protein [Thaumarchaeota archaeon]|nr:DUF424 domain-containing protein [Nitrososphaerota archaeon]MCY3976299.1 DUF424 domain-containing protein [Nitrososphaerota archaeon]
MHKFSYRLSSYQNNLMLNICDDYLLDKKINDKNLTLHISKSCFGNNYIDQNTASCLLQQSSIINMVGNNIISLAIHSGIGSKNGIKEINNIQFLIVFKI